MIVNEERFSSALRTPDTSLVFDDIGCMLDYRAEHAGVTVVEEFVHDYTTQRWISAGNATYVMASAGVVASPMGSGAVAFETPDDANTQARTWDAPLMDYSRLPAARRAWKEARR
jgi:hypothetical protein